MSSQFAFNRLIIEPPHFVLGRINYAERVFTQFNFDDPAAGDLFFEIFGVGNSSVMIDKPLERFLDYEYLLKILIKKDKEKYNKIHKGTAYYFLAWLSFVMKSYEKAVFYMDAAISEDIRKTEFYYRQNDPLENRESDELSSELFNIWIQNPAGKFFTLDDSTNQAAKDITDSLSKIWQSFIKEFNNTTNSAITLDGFINKFILTLAKKPASRSIITALYSFVLEYYDIKDLIILRSSNGGSLEPILTFLFKGGLIFESLLKFIYPYNDQDEEIKTIGKLNSCSRFTTRYVRRINTSSNSLQNIVSSINRSGDLQVAFNTTARIRNTTGHNLQWDDVFNNEDNFDKLFFQIISAILFICKKDFLDESPQL